MKIIVQAKTGARAEKVEKIQVVTNKKLPFAVEEDSVLTEKNSTVAELDTYKVFIKEQPVEGRANHSIKKVLAEYFNVAPSCVIIVSGHTSKRKVFEILI